MDAEPEWAQSLRDDYGIEPHEHAAFTCPKWDTPGACICGELLPPRKEWNDAGGPYPWVNCIDCGTGYVDEEEFIAIYDDGVDL